MQECYDRQWRDACDDARTLDSKANTEWVTAQRWEQVAEKAAKEEASVAKGCFLPKILFMCWSDFGRIRAPSLGHGVHLDDNVVHPHAVGSIAIDVPRCTCSSDARLTTSKRYLEPV